MQLPNDITHLTTLKALNLDFNMFRQFPATVGALKTLVQLYIEHNELTHLPSIAIASLKSLQVLFWRLSLMLQMLYLGHNKLKELPPNIAELPQLQRLYAGNNQLTNLPDLGTLENLEVLKVECNGISQVYHSIFL